MFEDSVLSLPPPKIAPCFLRQIIVCSSRFHTLFFLDRIYVYFKNISPKLTVPSVSGFTSPSKNLNIIFIANSKTSCPFVFAEIMHSVKMYCELKTYPGELITGFV